MKHPRDKQWLIASVALALLLNMLPWPMAIEGFKPYWLGMVVVYWLVNAPVNKLGLGFAFGVGLLGDVFQGNLLGEQALRCIIIAFLVLRFRTRLSTASPMQLGLFLSPLFMNDRVVQWVVLRLNGYEVTNHTFWMGALVAAVLWPMFDVLLTRLRVYRGRRSD